MLSRSWEIAVCLTCPKQSNYFDKRDVTRFLPCYICNGDFCDNSLRLDPINNYYQLLSTTIINRYQLLTTIIITLAPRRLRRVPNVYLSR